MKGDEGMTNEEALIRAKNFMESYAVSKGMIRMNRKGKRDEEGELFCEESDECFWRARMLAVRKFVMSVDVACYKQILFYHYIKGETVEGCAELMEISRRSAFRIKKRALEYVAQHKFGYAKNSL